MLTPHPEPAAAERILIVDDEDLVAQTLVNFFRLKGFEVQSCNSAVTALERADLQNFQLLIADLQMPQIDGIELIQRMQVLNPDLASILMTGNASVESAIEAMRQGAVDYVQKPFKFADLLALVLRALDGQRLRQSNRRLQAELVERLEQLTAVNLELDAFAARLAHDLRGPINNMRGIQGLLLEELGPTLEPDLRDLMQRGVKSGDVALKMVSDLLEFARLGTADMALQPLDLQPLVEQVLLALRDDLPAERFQVRTDGLGRVMGHPGLLQQVFTNLVHNAVKYSASRPVIRVDITGEPEDDWLVVSVSDNGVGFDPAQVAQLFRPFQRLHNDANFAGQGMGLANVKRIVERHGGMVRAEGRPDAGARFTIWLKAAEA